MYSRGRKYFVVGRCHDATANASGRIFQLVVGFLLGCHDGLGHGNLGLHGPGWPKAQSEAYTISITVVPG
eukprot:3840699-Rhodomonas_salina.2